MEDELLKKRTENVMESQAKDNYMGIVIAFLTYGWTGALDWHNEEYDQIMHSSYESLLEALDSQFASINAEERTDFLLLTEDMAKFKEKLRNVLQEMEG